MTPSLLLWRLFSADGLLSFLFIGAVWLWVQPKSRAARRTLLAIVLFYMLASLYPIPRAVAFVLGRGFEPLTRSDVSPGRSVVVLLGSGAFTRLDWENGRMTGLDDIGAERTVEAARIFRMLNAEWIISSGGLVDPEDDRETASGLAMRDALVGLGVPVDRIVLEETSRNTHEEAVQVAQMLPRMGVEHVVLVTSELHMPRALGAFRHAGIAAIPGIARDWRSPDWRLFWPSGTGLRQTSLVVHELMGLMYYRARGWYE